VNATLPIGGRAGEEKAQRTVTIEFLAPQKERVRIEIRHAAGATQSG
jgi:hypothetical protein